MKHAILLIFLIGFIQVAKAIPTPEPLPELEQAQLEIAGVVVCPEDSTGSPMGYCQYTLLNLTKAQILVKKVEQTIFQGIPLTPPEGLLEALGENDKVLAFWHTDPAVLAKMKEVLPILDTRESFSTSSIIEVKTDIYEVTESGLSNLGAEITNLKLGSGVGDLPNATTVNGSGAGLGIDLKIGVIQLSGLISAERSRGTLKRRASIVRAVPNLSSITYSDSTPVYFAPGAGTNVFTQNAGIKLEGKVSINDENDKLVNIKDFNLHYGVMTENGNVSTVELPYENLLLEEGISFPLVSSKSVGKMKVVKSGLFGFGRSEEMENTKLLVYTTVKVYGWDEYVGKIKDLLKVGKQRFSPAEMDQMEKACPDVDTMLEDLELIAKRDALGDPMLAIKLRKDYACQDNIKTRLRVKISGEGINKKENEHLLTVERLMHIPIRIQGIPLSKFTEPELDFKVKIQVLGKRTKKNLELRFAPGPYDIEDMFWIR